MNSDFCVAVHSAVFLSHNKRAFSSEQIALNVCTHPSRIRRVLSKLCKANLLKSEEGANGGGYSFCGNAEEVTLYDIAKAVGARFAETAWKSGNAEMDCVIASGMGELMDNLFLKLNENCYSALKKISINDIDDALKNKKYEV